MCLFLRLFYLIVSLYSTILFLRIILNKALTQTILYETSSIFAWSNIHNGTLMHKRLEMHKDAFEWRHFCTNDQLCKKRLLHRLNFFFLLFILLFLLLILPLTLSRYFFLLFLFCIVYFFLFLFIKTSIRFFFYCCFSYRCLVTFLCLFINFNFCSFLVFLYYHYYP